MKLIDANVILRYLLREPPEQAEQARAVIAAGAFTTMEVMAEVVYVLQKVYGVRREEISAAVMRVAGEVGIAEYDALSCAMELFQTRNLDFVDCALAARSFVNGDEVFSFDKKLMAAIHELDAKKALDKRK